MVEKPDSKTDPSELLALTADIVVSHVANNTVAVADLSSLIQQVYIALSGVEAAGGVAGPPSPAVSIKLSITPDYIICLEDGKKLKMLKRHLKTRYNLSPDEYRKRWGLPADYPIVAPNYAKQRSLLAKKFGLGNKRRKRKR
jgi:predicted transcriptional regulator